MQSRGNAVQGTMLLGVTLLVAISWFFTRAEESSLASNSSRGAAPRGPLDEPTSTPDAPPSRAVRSEAGDQVFPQATPGSTDHHASRSARSFLPFELPGHLASAEEYPKSAAFNRRRVRLTAEELEDLSALIEGFNQSISEANREALTMLEQAVTWKVELGAVQDVSASALDSTSEYSWVVFRTYADGTKKTVVILPGEYGPLDGACFRAQELYLSGEAALEMAMSALPDR